MKIFTAHQMREIENEAYAEGASEESFMEKAGEGIARVTEEYIKKNNLKKNILLLCAKGNNSGDAYVAGRYLLAKGYKVSALQTAPLHSCSPLCAKNHLLFLEAGGKILQNLQIFPKDTLILDGLFGTGFKGTIEEPLASLVNAANQSKLPIIAIDIPSGLNGDNGIAQGPVIQANETVYLGAPKTGFFFNDGWNQVGKLRYVDFGLSEKLIDKAPSKLRLTTTKEIKTLIPPIKRDWHKYERGYVVGLAGSQDMPGAAILSSWAALAAGAGIVRLMHPEGMDAELSAAPLELVRQTYRCQELEPVIESLNKATATFIGPGIGRSSNTLTTLKYALQNIQKPCVIDADALTLIAENDLALPKQTILTPHHGEMLRLLGSDQKNLKTEELLERAQNYANEKKITLVLKGAPTFILQEGQPIYVNPTGDPGMATAGSGDVLTGIIAAMLSHKLSLHDAAILGVFMHGLAGEFAAKEKTSNCVIASDLIVHFPDSYKSLS